MQVMQTAVAVRNEQLNFLANKFIFTVAKQLFRLGIDLNNRPIAVDRYDGIGKGFKDFSERKNLSRTF